MKSCHVNSFLAGPSLLEVLSILARRQNCCKRFTLSLDFRRIGAHPNLPDRILKLVHAEQASIGAQSSSFFWAARRALASPIACWTKLGGGTSGGKMLLWTPSTASSPRTRHFCKNWSRSLRSRFRRARAPIWMPSFAARRRSASLIYAVYVCEPGRSKRRDSFLFSSHGYCRQKSVTRACNTNTPE